MKTKKAFLCGDYTNPHWHTIAGVDQEIRKSLDPLFDLKISENYESLSESEMKEYDLIILYTDKWADKSASAPGLAPGLLRFVANGGNLMVLHYPTVSFDSELAQMVGAAFKNHPPFGRVRYVPASDHPIMNSMEAFEIDDEPYMFTFDPMTERETLLILEHQGQRLPAAWLVRYAAGRVVYIAPGHNAKSYRNSQMQKLLKQSASWMCGIIK